MADILRDTKKNTPLKNISEQFILLRNSPHTQKAYRSDMGQFLAFQELEDECLGAFLGISLPDMLTHISSFLEQFKKLDVDGNVINPNTVNRKRYTLVAFFRHLIETYDYPKNPAVLLPVLPKADQSNTPALSEAEIQAFMRHMKQRKGHGEKQFRDYLIVLGLFHFALRRRELASLKWSDIFPNPIPHFQLREKGGSKKYLPIPPKYMAQLDEFTKLYGKPYSFIFHPVKNNRTKTLQKPLSTNAILDIVTDVAEQLCPGRGITPHSFRSSFVSLARQYGLDDKMIMNATGHSSSDMINYYDVRKKLEANAINFFGEWIE